MADKGGLGRLRLSAHPLHSRHSRLHSGLVAIAERGARVARIGCQSQRRVAEWPLFNIIDNFGEILVVLVALAVRSCLDS